MQIGIQTYLFRRQMRSKEQQLYVIEKLAAMGYGGIELFHATELPPAELKAAAGKAELLNPHVSFGDLVHRLDATIAWAKELGVKSVCLGYVSPFSVFYRTLHLREVIFRAAELCRKNGIALCYHNHWQEIRIKHGNRAIDWLSTNPFLVFELDTHWVEQGGSSVKKELEAHKNRVPYLHLKDRTEKGKFCPIGSGVADIPGYLLSAKSNGCKWAIVDLDNSTEEAYESAQKSLSYLKTRC